jgi:flagellar basal-body rod protein FlgB
MTAILDNLYSQENYLISKKLLDATHLRHETLANNLANVETPGFKRRDLPKTFSVELRRAADKNDLNSIKSMYPLN